MIDFKGTKGFWYYENNGESKAIFHPTQIGVRLALVDETFTGSGWNVKANDEWKYNIKLIATAPELLEALQSTLALINSTFKNEGWDCEEYTEVIKGREAVKKALGL